MNAFLIQPWRLVGFCTVLLSIHATNCFYSFSAHFSFIRKHKKAYGALFADLF